jgi:hypothetical protein
MSRSYRSHFETRVPRPDMMSRDIVPTCVATSFHVSSYRPAGSRGRDRGLAPDQLALVGDHPDRRPSTQRQPMPVMRRKSSTQTWLDGGGSSSYSTTTIFIPS